MRKHFQFGNFSHRSRNESAKGKVSTSGFLDRLNSGWASISAAFFLSTTFASTKLYQIRVKCPTTFSFVALSNIEIFRFVAATKLFYSTQFPFLDEKKKLSFYFFATTDFFRFFRSIAKFRSLSVPTKFEARPQKCSSLAFMSIRPQVFASRAL